MPQKTYTAAPYKPTSPLTGSEQGILRGQNMILEGQYPNLYFRSYKGSEEIEEALTSAITGTIEYSPSSLTITGIGTEFLDELHIGQMIQAEGGEPIVVGQLLTQTTFIADRLPTTTGSGETATRLPVMGELNVNRFTMLRGNAVQFDRQTIMAVGDGTLWVNGAPLSGDSLSASRQVKIAVYDSATQTYDVQSVGFEEIPDVVNTDVSVVASGGTKNMSLGYYSFKVAYYSDITNGFGNPTDTLLSGGTTGYQLTVANSTFEIDFTNDVGNRPAKATGYIIYGTAFSGSSAISATNAIQGGWFEVKRVAFADLVSQATTFEYVDSELGSLVSFDNDMPPDAEFISTIDLYPFLISTDGQGVDSPDRETTTSPGAFVSPAKPENLDAYPAGYKVPTSKGEVIIGVVQAAGRFFVMTANTLQAVTPTGLPSAPFTCRPFWRRGFTNPYNLIFVDDTLYGYSGKKLFRSTGTADTANESYEFASDVEAQLAESSGGYVFVAHDPKNELICVFLSAIRQNDDDYWETDVYSYSLTKSIWMPKVVLTSTERDMIVSGAATVNNDLYFVIGGRSPVAPPALEGAIFCCGGECQNQVTVSNGNAHWTDTSGITVNTSVVRSGHCSISVQATSGTYASALDGTAGNAIFVGRFYFRMSVFPVVETYIFWSGTTVDGEILGIGFNPATNTIHCTSGITGVGPYTLSFAGAGYAISLNTWYRVDFLCNRNTGTLDAQITIDGSQSPNTLTQATDVIGTANASSFIGYVPNSMTATGTIYYDDILISSDADDYPLGDGYVHGFVPTADGVHNVTAANQFERGSTGVDITNATTNAYDLVDAVPFNTNIGVASLTDALNPLAYVEVDFGPGVDSTVPTEAPRMVSSVSACVQSTAAGNVDCEIQLVDNASEGEMLAWATASTTPYYQSEVFATAPSGASWTINTGGNGDFNNLKARFYALSQAASNMVNYFTGATLEAEFETNPPNYTTAANVYKWDSPSNDPINWFLAWCFQDDGVEINPKVLRKLRAKGKLTDATMSVFAVTPDSEIDVTDLETGANALINISLDDSTEITQYAVNKVRCKNMLMSTVRIEGTSTYDGTGVIDQLHEIAAIGDVSGQER